MPDARAPVIGTLAENRGHRFVSIHRAVGIRTERPPAVDRVVAGLFGRREMLAHAMSEAVLEEVAEFAALHEKIHPLRIAEIRGAESGNEG